MKAHNPLSVDSSCRMEIISAPCNDVLTLPFCFSRNLCLNVTTKHSCWFFPAFSPSGGRYRNRLSALHQCVTRQSLYVIFNPTTLSICTDHLDRSTRRAMARTVPQRPCHHAARPQSRENSTDAHPQCFVRQHHPILGPEHRDIRCYRADHSSPKASRHSRLLPGARIAAPYGPPRPTTLGWRATKGQRTNAHVHDDCDTESSSGRPVLATRVYQPSARSPVLHQVSPPALLGICPQAL